MSDIQECIDELEALSANGVDNMTLQERVLYNITVECVRELDPANADSYQLTHELMGL